MMEQQDAVDLLRPAIPAGTGTWSDFGAGTGTFTRALATILGPGSQIFAVDRDVRALRALESLERRNDGGPRVVRVRGDIEDLDRIPDLADVRLDGAIFANALHFVADAGRVLGSVVESCDPADVSSSSNTSATARRNGCHIHCRLRVFKRLREPPD